MRQAALLQFMHGKWVVFTHLEGAGQADTVYRSNTSRFCDVSIKFRAAFPLLIENRTHNSTHT